MRGGGKGGKGDGQIRRDGGRGACYVNINVYVRHSCRIEGRRTGPGMNEEELKEKETKTQKVHTIKAQNLAEKGTARVEAAGLSGDLSGHFSPLLVLPL